MEKNNKLIAQFMGLTNHHNDSSMMVTKTPQGNETVPIDSLQYDSSWDWLMPVVHKCYQEHTCSQERMNSNDAYEIKTCDITRVYKAVVEFIKNKNN